MQNSFSEAKKPGVGLNQAPWCHPKNVCPKNKCYFIKAYSKFKLVFFFFYQFKAQTYSTAPLITIAKLQRRQWLNIVDRGINNDGEWIVSARVESETSKEGWRMISF